MDESRWGQPVQLSCTILIKNVTNFNETAFKRALEITEDVNVHRALAIGDQQVLIDFTTNTPGRHTVMCIAYPLWKPLLGLLKMF